MQGEPVPASARITLDGTVFRYAGAVLSVAIGVVLGLWLQPVLDAAVLLLPSVAIAAWFSGLWPALLASLLATLALDYFFTPPFHTFTAGFAHVPHLIAFTVLAALAASAGAARRTAEQSLRQARDELETRVRERTADLTRANKQLEELPRRLIHAQEQERSRIGRELHDHVSQVLGVLAIKLDQLRSAAGIPRPLAAALDDLRQSTRDLSDDVHRLSHRLHSSTLDYLGLGPALQKLVGEYVERQRIPIDLTQSGLPSDLPSEVALCLFRVTEESLTNMIKHSHAGSARVVVRGDIEGIHLVIEDDGVGFDQASSNARAGLGFVSMRERLHAVGGSLRVDSTPLRGTRIEVSVPANALGDSAGARVPDDSAAREHLPA